MPSTNPHLCAHCLQPLIYIPVGRYYRIVCDNTKNGRPCLLSRECQGIMPRENNKLQDKHKRLPSAHVFRPGYEEYNERGRKNYQFARSLSIPSKIASKLRNKSKKEIKKVAKEMVGGMSNSTTSLVRMRLITHNRWWYR